jgi:hypothetical protein
VNQAPVLKNHLVPFFLLPCFFSNPKKKQGLTPQNGEEEKTRKKEKHKIVNGNTRNNVGSWIYIEKIENNIKDKKCMCCIATERREN